jgi:hypothetical protein
MRRCVTTTATDVFPTPARANRATAALLRPITASDPIDNRYTPIKGWRGKEGGT